MPRMAGEKAREFEAGIAGRAEHRGFKFGRHYAISELTDPLTAKSQINFAFEAYLSIIMHKYSSSVNGLRQSVKSKGGLVTSRKNIIGIRALGPRRRSEQALHHREQRHFVKFPLRLRMTGIASSFSTSQLSRRSLDVPPAAGT